MLGIPDVKIDFEKQRIRSSRIDLEDNVVLSATKNSTSIQILLGRLRSYIPYFPNDSFLRKNLASRSCSLSHSRNLYRPCLPQPVRYRTRYQKIPILYVITHLIYSDQIILGINHKLYSLHNERALVLISTPIDYLYDFSLFVQFTIQENLSSKRQIQKSGSIYRGKSSRRKR